MTAPQKRYTSTDTKLSQNSSQLLSRQCTIRVCGKQEARTEAIHLLIISSRLTDKTAPCFSNKTAGRGLSTQEAPRTARQSSGFRAPRTRLGSWPGHSAATRPVNGTQLFSESFPDNSGKTFRPHRVLIISEF